MLCIYDYQNSLCFRFRRCSLRMKTLMLLPYYLDIDCIPILATSTEILIATVRTLRDVECRYLRSQRISERGRNKCFKAVLMTSYMASMSAHGAKAKTTQTMLTSTDSAESVQTGRSLRISGRTFSRERNTKIRNLIGSTITAGTIEPV